MPLALIELKHNEPLTSPPPCPPPVINLSSSVKLSDVHFGIFEKGPKFVPTPPKADFAEFQEDITVWKNRLRWAIYFDSRKNSDDQQLSLPPPDPIEKALIKKAKSNYDAPISKNYALELFLQKIDEEIKDHKEKKSIGDNLTKEERKALNEMRLWKTTIIRPYDKGVGFIIDDVDNYKSRILKEISNTDFYTPVTNIDSAIGEINTRIQSWADKYSSEISTGLKTWIVDYEADFGYFYMNYKAHKPDKGYPARMITSGCGSPRKDYLRGVNTILNRS